MAYWAAVRFQPGRYRLACQCLRERGVEVWMPFTAEKRIVHGRRRLITVPLFNNYAFAVVTLQWSGHYCPVNSRTDSAGC